MVQPKQFLDKVASTRFQREVQQIYESLAKLEKREKQGTLGEEGRHHRRRLNLRLASLEEAFGRARPGDMGTRTVRTLGVGGQSAAFQTVGDIPIKTKLLRDTIDQMANQQNLTPSERSAMIRGAAATGMYTPGFHVVKVTPPEMANLPAFSKTLDADGNEKATHERSAVAFDPPADGKGEGGFSKATPLTPEHIINARSNLAQQFGEGYATSHALLPYNVPGATQQGVVQVQEYVPHVSVPYTASPEGHISEANLNQHLDAVNAVLSKLPPPNTPNDRSIDTRGVAVDVVENNPDKRTDMYRRLHDPKVWEDLRVAVHNGKYESFYRPNTLNASAQVRGDHNFGDIRSENIRITHDGQHKLIDAYDFTHEPLVVASSNPLQSMSAVERQKALGSALRGATLLTDAQRSAMHTLNAHTHAAPVQTHPYAPPPTNTDTPPNATPNPHVSSSIAPPSLSSPPSTPPPSSPHARQPSKPLQPSSVPSTPAPIHTPLKQPHVSSPHAPASPATTNHTQTPKKFPWGLVAGIAAPLALGAGAAVLHHYAAKDDPKEDETKNHRKYAAKLSDHDVPYFDDDVLAFVDSIPTNKHQGHFSIFGHLPDSITKDSISRIPIIQRISRLRSERIAPRHDGKPFDKITLNDLLAETPEEHWSEEVRAHLQKNKPPTPPNSPPPPLSPVQPIPAKSPTPPVSVEKQEPPLHRNTPPVLQRAATPPAAPPLPPIPAKAPTPPVPAPEEPPPWKDPAPESQLRGSILRRAVPKAPNIPQAATSKPVSLNMIAPPEVKRIQQATPTMTEDPFAHLDDDLRSYARSMKDQEDILHRNQFVHPWFTPDPSLEFYKRVGSLENPEITRRQLNVADHEKVTVDHLMQGIPREHWHPNFLQHIENHTNALNESLPEDQRFRLTRQDNVVKPSFAKDDPIIYGSNRGHRFEDHLRRAVYRENAVREKNPDRPVEPTSLENLQVGETPASIYTPQERASIFRAIPKTPNLPQDPIAGDPTRDFNRPVFVGDYPSATLPSLWSSSPFPQRQVTGEDVKKKIEGIQHDTLDTNRLNRLPEVMYQEILGQGIANREEPIRIFTPQANMRKYESEEFVNALGLNRPVREREGYVRDPKGYNIPEYFDKLHPSDRNFTDDAALSVIYDKDENGFYTKRRGGKGLTGFVQGIGDSLRTHKDPDTAQGLDNYFLAPRLSPGVLQWAKGTPISTQGEVSEDVRRNLISDYEAGLINTISQSAEAAHHLATSHHALRSDPRVMGELARINDLKHRKRRGEVVLPEQLQPDDNVLGPYRNTERPRPSIPTQEEVDRLWTETVAKPFLSHAASRGEGAMGRLLHPLAQKKLETVGAGTHLNQAIGLGEANLAQNRFAVSSAHTAKERLERELADVRNNPHLVEGSRAATPDQTMTVPGWFADRTKHNEFARALGDEPHQHLTQEAVQPVLDAMREHAASAQQTGASQRTLNRWEEFQKSLPTSEANTGQNAAHSLLHATPKEELLRLAKTTELHSSNPKSMEERIKEILSDHMRSGVTAVDMPADIAQRQIAAHKENTLKRRIDTVDEYIRRREASFGMNVEELTSIPLAVQSNKEINPALEWMAQAQRQQRRAATVGGYYNPYGTGLLDASIVDQSTPSKVTTDFPSLEEINDPNLHQLVRQKEQERLQSLKRQYGSVGRIPEDIPLQDASIYPGTRGNVVFRNNVAKTYEFPGEDLLDHEPLSRSLNPYQQAVIKGVASKTQFQPINLPAESRENVEKLVTNLTPQQIVQAQQTQEYAKFQQEAARAHEVKQKLEALAKYRANADSIPQAPGSQQPAQLPQPQSPPIPSQEAELPPHHIDHPDFVNNLMKNLEKQKQELQATRDGAGLDLTKDQISSVSKGMQSENGAIREATEEEIEDLLNDPSINASSSNRSAASGSGEQPYGKSPTNAPVDYSNLTPEEFKRLEEEFSRGELDPKRFGAPPIDPNNKEQLYEHFRKSVEDGKTQVHPDMEKAIKGMTPEQFGKHMAASEEVMEVLKKKGLSDVDPAAFAAAVEHAPHLKNVENLAKHMETFKGFEKYFKRIGDVLTGVAKWFNPKAHSVLEGTYDELQPQNNLLHAISTHQHNPLEGTYSSLQPDQGFRQSMLNTHNVNSSEVINDAGNLLSFLPSELGLSPAAIAQQEAQAASGEGFGSKLWKSISTPRSHNVIDPAQVIAGMESKPSLAPSALWDRLNNAISKIEVQPKHLVIPGLALGALGGSALYDYWNRRGSGGG